MFIFTLSIVEIIKTYKYKLKLTKDQAKRVDSWIHTSRFVYNLALEIKIHVYNSRKINLSFYDLSKQLTGLRKEYNWVKDVPFATLQDAIERLDKSYKKFFKGAGFPKFINKDKYKSIAFKTVKERDGKIVLPKLGSVKYFNSRPIKGELRRATIIKENNNYYISVLTKQERETTVRTHDRQVGIDVGVSFFLTLSNGEQVENPRHILKYEKQLRIEQRSLARKVKGSKSRQKQKLKVSKLHEKIRNVRKDFLHKQSTEITNRFDLIAVEALKVKNMMKFGYLSKHIADVSWGEFFRQLEYKSDWYGNTFVKVDPKYTSQTCNDCGSIDKKSRISQSKFVCTSCGTESNADINASKNILGRAMSSLTERSGLPQACGREPYS